MEIRHARVQHPVGQGFFHTAKVWFGGRPFRYVYDCGSKNRDALERSVHSFVSGMQPSPNIDLLFLSHLHEDHTNGLEVLLGSNPRLRVGNVVLPYLHPLERLVVGAVCSAAEPWFWGFLANPVRWLLGGGHVRQVTYVYGDDDGSEDGHRRNLDRLSPEQILESLQGEESELRVEMNTTSGPPKIVNSLRPGEAQTEASFLDHREPIGVRNYVGPPIWEFLTYVDAKWKGADKIQGVLEDILSPEELDDAKSGGPELAAMLADDSVRSRVATAYRRAGGKNLNKTSLILWSGPAIKGAEWFARVGSTGVAQISGPRFPISFGGATPRCAWLGTGDAEIGGGQAYSRMRSMFRPNEHNDVLCECSCVVLPHHGSSRNLNRQLVTDTDANLFLVSSAKSSQYGHPHPDVVEMMVEEGQLLFQVSEDQDSGVVETFRLDIERS